MAERLLRHALKAEGDPLNQIEVRSAGIAAGNGYLPSPNSVAALKKVGIDLEDHITGMVTVDELLDADYIFAMTHGHLVSLQNLLGDQKEDRLYLMREFLEDTDEPEIPDPFGLGFTHYENARDSMVEAIPSIVSFLKSKFPDSV